MKRFRLITETDARILERGSTVCLADGGHVTPLALDTLRERRVYVAREDGVDSDPGGLAPASVGTIAVGGDRSARGHVEHILRQVRAMGLSALDTDLAGLPRAYPVAAEAVARLVANGEADAGVVVDETGFGSAVVANKVPGVRATMCASATHARLARESAGANVLTLGFDLIGPDDAVEIIEAFVRTTMRDPERVRILAAVARLDRDRGRL
jgi:ribose 5-phosphate isomerase B